MSLPIKEFLGNSAIFKLDIIDLPDGVEHALKYRFVSLKRELYGKNNTDICAIVLRLACRSPEDFTDLMHGFVYGILTEPEEAAKV